jgi:poly-D-alanine transfer protein DltD
MKNYKSTKEGEWFEQVSVELTNDQRILMRSRQLESQEYKELMEYIDTNSKKEVTEDVFQVLETSYNKYKPKLKETDSYELIGVSITIEGNKGRGIINCRLNGEHKQIRAYE